MEFQIFHRKPEFNAWIILGLVTVAWFGIDAWIISEMEAGKFLLGDDATTAHLTGTFMLAGMLMGMAGKLVRGSANVNALLMPNLLFVVGGVVLYIYQVIQLVVIGMSLGIELKAVVVGLVLSSLFSLLGGLVTVAAQLMERLSTQEERGPT